MQTRQNAFSSKAEIHWLMIRGAYILSEYLTPEAEQALGWRLSPQFYIQNFTSISIFIFLSMLKSKPLLYCSLSILLVFVQIYGMSWYSLQFVIYCLVRITKCSQSCCLLSSVSKKLAHPFKIN